ncbi:MAG: UDP-N-acetylglucosamine 1-carboxyvinyltransferase [Clostridia bacterium]|nr:UDP-N-acetylglucosamine 1-carboxyvinyltransferase [Clostridia bacterium]
MQYEINGGVKLRGECRVQGSKNSALPILACTLLCGGESVIRNCPVLSDVEATIHILRHLGCRVGREGHTVTVDSSVVVSDGIPDVLMREMRSSVIFLGAILARNGRAALSMPGGCEIGLRPIDLHLDAMRRLGAQVKEEFGKIVCEAPQGLTGAKISLSFPSVGATENVMIAASCAKGVTQIVNAAREPEISDLADFLNSCGAKIAGAGEGSIVIEGVAGLHPTEHTVIPDRIAAATYMAAAAATGGSIRLRSIIPAHLGPEIAVFEEAGCRIESDCRNIRFSAPERLRGVKMIRTMPYPGFPTDIQPPVAAMLTVADGASVIIETIFENRFKYIGELVRFGARIRVDGRMAVIDGVERLYGANVIAPDLRGGAALMIAGLSAEGKTRISGIRHIDRGYEAPEEVFSGLSADVKRIEEDGATEPEQ